MSARILYVMSGRPWPYDRGDRIRNYHLLRALLPDNDVTLLTLDVEPSEALPDDLAGCRHVSMGVPFWQQGMAVLGHPGMPVTSARRSGWLLERRVRSAMRGLAWDVVVAAQLRAVPVALALNGSPHVVDLTDSLWDLYSQDASAARTLVKRCSAGANAARARRYESFALSRVELATVSSETDATALRALGGSARIHVIPNGADVVTRNVDLASEHGVLFVGNCLYGPNLEGLLWFVREVWPLVLCAASHRISAGGRPGCPGSRVRARSWPVSRSGCRRDQPCPEGQWNVAKEPGSTGMGEGAGDDAGGSSIARTGAGCGEPGGRY